jgi:quinol monooxygenase YgiN
MIIIVGTLKVAPEDREAFIAGRIESMQRSRGEDGCITYALAPDPIEPDTIVLTERWTSQEALDAHAANMRANPAPLTIPLVSREIMVYEVASSRPL